MRGRGAAENPPNRFEPLHVELEPDDPGEGERRVPTTYLRDPTRTIIATNDSPDVGFDAGINPYRGCAHGCIYCYARPTHEFLGFSAGLDFETKILVKDRAPELLRRTLASPRWKPQTIALSGNTDAYQPVERRLRLTRRCLEVLHEFRNPVAIITKGALVTRDVDLLGDLARDGAASVIVTLTSLDPELQRRMEPRASRPDLRLRAIETLARAGVPVGTLVAPVVPGLNDHEIPKLLEAVAAAGGSSASWVMLKLPHANKALFESWLDRHYPDRKAKILNRLRAVRGGGLNDPRFGTRQRGEGFFADQVGELFDLARRRAGLARSGPALSTAAFRRPGGDQLGLFGSA